jgi:hypothetical protein
MTSILAPVELWHFRSFRAAVSPGAAAELVWDWLAPTEEAVVVDVSYSTPAGTSRHAILVDWYDPTADVSRPSRKVVAQTTDNAVFWNPVRWFIPRSPDGSRRWVLRAVCAVPGGVLASLDVSVAIVRSAGGETR